MDLYEKRKDMLEEKKSNKKRRKSFATGIDDLKKEYETEVERADDAEKAFFESLKSKFDEEFIWVQIIGEGAYAKVSKCTHRFDGHDYAVKRIRFVGCKDSLMSEVKALASLEHKNIIRYFSSWMEVDDVEDKGVKIIRYGEGGDDEDQDLCYFDLRGKSHRHSTPIYMSIFIQMELCDRRLYDDICNGIDRQTALNYFKQIVDAVAYIHGNDMIHRDLASVNIFLNQSSHVKVADFGIVKIGNEDLHKASPGHEVYSAPERSEPSGTIDAKVDIFSLGIILLELLSHFASARERAEELQKFVNGQTFKDVVSKQDKMLILRLTSTDPAERPSAADLRLMLTEM
ncbi:hypothetical protein MKW92_046234 [Papaver armeniacum]|nr:hypothetical protein MKW92_046234 [Papaver armeniacum]